MKQADDFLKDLNVLVMVTGGKIAVDDKDKRHYEVSLKYVDPRKVGSATFPVFWKRGEVPTQKDILNNVITYASTFEVDHSYVEWCATQGFNPRNDATRRMFWLAQLYASQLRRFLGNSYQDFLYQTEN